MSVAPRRNITNVTNEIQNKKDWGRTRLDLSVFVASYHNLNMTSQLKHSGAMKLGILRLAYGAVFSLTST